MWPYRTHVFEQCKQTTSTWYCLLFIVLFAISYKKQKKSNYLNFHGEEAQEKPPGS